MKRYVYPIFAFVFIVMGINAFTYNIYYGFGEYRTEIEQKEGEINYLDGTVDITTYVWIRKNSLHVGDIQYSSYKTRIPLGKSDSVKRSELNIAKLSADTISLNLAKLK